MSKFTFDEWYAFAEDYCFLRYGVFIDLLSDYPWRGAYRRGLTPFQAARAAVLASWRD